MVIGLTLIAFGLSLYGLTHVQRQFFPDSDRSELIVDFTLPQNASIEETSRLIARFETEMLKGKDGVDHWSTYVGRSAVRFLLTFDQEPAAPYLGQIIVVTRDEETRDRLRAEFSAYLHRSFPGVDSFVRLLEIGPPVGRPVAYRLSGPDIEGVREASGRLAAVVAANPHVDNVVADWGEPGRVVKVDVMQDKARLLGVSSQDISNALYSIIGGATVTRIRDGIYQIAVVGRALAEERNSIETLKNLQLASATGVSVPLAAVANLRYEIERWDPALQEADVWLLVNANRKRSDNYGIVVHWGRSDAADWSDGAAVFDTAIPRNVRVSEAPSHGLPVTVYDFRSPARRPMWRWPPSCCAATANA